MRKREREVMLKLYHKTHPYCTAFPRQLLLVSYLGLRNNKDKERERGGEGNWRELTYLNRFLPEDSLYSCTCSGRSGSIVVGATISNFSRYDDVLKHVVLLV